MSARPGRQPQEIKAAWPNPPAITLIDGPYSVMMWNRTAKDPDDPSKMYTWNHYDVVRMENGHIKEHWDEARINPPQPGAGKQ